MITGRVLVLNNGMEPHRIVGWQRAVNLIFLAKAEVIEEIDEILYRSPEMVVRMPSVVRLLRTFRPVRRGIKFSRINVMTRDRFTCQYCGTQKGMRELNYDHVIPRNMGGPTTWENIVTCCYPCNARKRNRTPEQAAMQLLSTPKKPNYLPVPLQLNFGQDFPPVWMQYVSWSLNY